MDIIWDEAKRRKLKETRGIVMEDVAQLILDGRYLDILENPARLGQLLFVISSRKFYTLYGKERP